jgi:hypothetical protein
MAEYDFKSLSSQDFALLARDLLQIELKVRLESFSPGPDSGIDFRHRQQGINLIVQCKHYAESGFNALTSILRRKERPKIDGLSPTRYVLATSVPMTPNRKDEIQQILRPHCAVPSDIYGREDLNNLLGLHAQIERKHFKLWLTSEPVLHRVLNAGIFSDSEAYLDRVRLRLSRYVENPSFQRALSLLDKSHYCIVAGIPGIGKTTLAQVLLAYLVDRQGFEAFRIAHDLDEIRPIKNTKAKQVFYFDDFLGKTGLDKLRKNEDQRLVDLIEEVASNQNWRFILTTREYILNAAKLTYEAFSHPPVDFTPCVIKLDDYTRPVRARILYNHIYFSDLPRVHKLALLQNKAYNGILGHRNYNPRVVEYMTDARHASSVNPSLYASEFTQSLEHPARIWDHAFRHQISEAARHLLLVLHSLPDEVLLTDLQQAFWTFYLFRQKRFGFSTSSEDWNNALKELDGNFVMTHRVGRDIVISLHNPSIRDFLEDFLSSSDSDVWDLIQGAHFYEQYARLWNGRRGKRYSGVDRHREAFLRQLEANIFGPSATAIRTVDSNGQAIGFRHWEPSHELRAQFALRIAEEFKTPAGEALLASVVGALERRWGRGEADREDLARLIDSLTKHGVTREDKAFKAARQCLCTAIEEIDHFRAIALFVDGYPEQFAPSEISALREKFLEFATGYVNDLGNDDPESYRQIASDLEFIGWKLDADVSELAESLENWAADIEAERGSKREEEGDDDDERWEPSPAEGNDVDGMFEGLREELEN